MRITAGTPNHRAFHPTGRVAGAAVAAILDTDEPIVLARVIKAAPQKPHLSARRTSQRDNPFMRIGANNGGSI